MRPQPLNLDFFQRLPRLIINRGVCESITALEVAEFPLRSRLLKGHAHLEQDAIYFIGPRTAEDRLRIIADSGSERHRLAKNVEITNGDLAS